jgi:autotransporter-associated beta strand protein
MNAKIWGRWLTRLFKQGRTVSRVRSRQRPLAFEPLEDRLTPTTYTWTGGAATPNWNNAGNWSSSVGGFPTNGADLVFGPGTTQLSLNNNLTGLVVNSITFSSPGYTLAGNAITLDGAINVGPNLGGEAIGLAMKLTPPTSALQQTFTVNSASTLSITGAISGNESTATLTAEQTLTKAGTGILQLGGNDVAYTGAITIATGILSISNQNALGTGGVVSGVSTAGTTTIDANAQLQVLNVNGTIGEQLKINGAGITNDGAILNVAGSNVWTGNVEMDSDSYFGANKGSSLSISGVISDLGAGHNLTKVGAGTLVFSHVGGDTYRGQTVIDNGILAIQDPLSLGAGANSLTTQSGTPQSETIVNNNPITGDAGTLELDYNPGSIPGQTTIPTTDPNAILSGGKVVGFQVFSDLLVLNGPGYTTLGALYNASGNNAWDGNMFLGSAAPSTGQVNIGVAASSIVSPNTDLTISGQISDPFRQPDLHKILGGRLILNDANIYHGNTFIDQGALNIRDSDALSSGSVLVASGAALQLEVDSGLDGTAQRTHNRNLGADSVTTPPGQEVYISGSSGSFRLSFKGATTVALNVNDPNLAADMQTALNNLVTMTSPVTVSQDGNVFRVLGGTLASANVPLMTVSNITGTPAPTVTVSPMYGLTVSNPIQITGLGIGPGTTGAIDSISGFNNYAGTITLEFAARDSVGVEQDPRPGHFTADNSFLTSDYSLTITGDITDTIPGTTSSIFTKAGPGNLILPSAKSYVDPNDIQAGLVTVENTLSLGSPQNVAQTLQSYTTVETGAAILINPTVPGSFLTLNNNFILSGNGIANPFGLLSQEGAIENIAGNNLLTGIIQLNGIAGIGVEQLFDQAPTTAPSELTLTGPLWDGASSGGIDKLGSRRLIIQGSGTYTGPVDVQQGVLLVQNDTALGAGGSSVTVESGAALELGNNTNSQNGGIQDGLNIWNQHLFLNGTGDPSFGDTPLTVLSSNALTSGPQVQSLAVTGSTTQTVTLTGSTTGTFTLTYDGVPTAALSATATAAQVQAALAANPALGAGGVTVTLANKVYTITTSGSNLITALGIGGTTATVGTVETVTIGGSTSGTFTLTYGGVTTSPLSATATAAQVQAALAANPALGAGGVTVTLANKVYTITTAGNGLLSASGNGVTTATVANSNFTLSFNGSPPTAPLPVTATALQVQNALDALPTISGLGSVSVTESGNVYLVTFLGGLSGANQPPITIASTPGSSVFVGTTQVGGGAGTISLAPVNDPLISTDNAWRGNVSLNSNTTINVPSGSRLIFTGTIDDVNNKTPLGSSLTLTGGGELDLDGVNTYHGTTDIKSGVLTAGSSQALGSTGISEVQTLTFKNVPNNTLFTLTYTGLTGVSATTGNITYSTTADISSLIAAALNGLSNIGGGTATDVGGSVSVVQLTPGVYQVTFGGTLSGFLQIPLTASIAGVTVAETTQGGGGTIVENGSSLQLAGGITIAGEPLLVEGNGSATPPSIPTQWFQLGPAPVSGGQTTGSNPVTGRITDEAVDPQDPNVIYVATAGGGVWKTIDGGKSWHPIFDSIPEIQTITVSPTATTFSLDFNGVSTGILDATSPTLALDIQNALNGLSNIGGVGGLVTVFQNGNSYRVTFGGILAGSGQPVITSSSSTVSVVETEAGMLPQFALFVGAVAIDPNNPNTIYVGTGETNNSPDSYYGTGVYKSTDAGVTWSLVTDGITSPGTNLNPFVSKGISQIIVANNGDVYVASGDGGTGKNEVQQLSFNGFPQLANTFTLSFTGADTTGTVVTDMTGPLTYYATGPGGTTTAADRVNIAAEIQGALDAFSNIGGVGGFVTVQSTGGFFGNRYTVTFQGNLAQTTLAQMTTSFPLPGPGVPPPTINVQITTIGGPATVINGTTGGPGVWRFTPSGSSGTWFDLTDVTSTDRGSVPSANKADAIYGPGGKNPIGYPATPGPDDDYRISFPQTNATWTSISLITNPNGLQVLYASLGTAKGTANNGVFWTDNPTSLNPVWYVGNPYTGTYSGANAVLTPDNISKNEFPTLAGGGAQNGNIKISGVSGGVTANEPIPPSNANPPFPGQPQFGFITMYASVANPNGTLQAIYVSTDGGMDWAPVATQPANFMSSQGQYDNAILAVSQTQVYVGGTASTIATQAGQIFENTTGGAGAWTDISNLAGNGPHVSQHSIVQDGANGVLFGNDGGLWRVDPASSQWTDLNGNLAISQVNSVAYDPTNINSAQGALQTNGTAGFSNSQTWTENNVNYGGEMGGSQIFIDPNNPSVMYSVETQLGGNAVVFASQNGGATWKPILQNPTIQSSDVPLAMDQLNPSHILVGGGANFGLYESFNQGQSFNPISANLPIAVTAIGLPEYQGAFNPDTSFPDVADQGANTPDQNTIYVTDGTSIYLTKDHGQTWVDRTGALTGLGSIVSIVVDPTNRDTAYIVRNSFGAGQVWMTTDAGQNWTEIATSKGLPDVPAWSLVVDPRNGNLYVGTDTGVYELANGSSQWQRFGTGMPDVQVHDLELNQTTNTLLAGTDGRSVYQLFLDSAETGTSPVTQSAVLALSGASVWAGPVILAGDPGTNSISIGALGTQNLPTNGISAGSVNFGGTISDISANSNATIDKTGGGDVIFSGVNTYGGTTDIQQGNLVVESGGTLGGLTNGTTVEPGASLVLRTNLGAEPVTLNGDGSMFNGHFTGALRNASGANTFSGNITLGSNDPNSTVTIGADTGSALTLTGAISGSNSAIGVVKEGTGTIALQGSDTYSGATNVYQGVLQAQNSLAFGNSVGVTVLDGAQVQLQTPTTGANAGVPVAINGIPLSLSGSGVFGTGALDNTGGNNSWTGPVTLGVMPGFAPNTLPAGDVSIGVDNSGDQLTLGGPIAETAEAGLFKTGNGELILTGTGTYSGGTEVSSGILDVRNPGALGSHPTADPTLATVQQIVTISPTSSGTFTVTFAGQSTTITFGSTSSPAPIVAAAINNLITAAGLSGTVSVTDTPIQTTTANGPGASGTGVLYTVTFQGALADTNLPLSATGSNGTDAAAGFVTAGGNDVLVDYAAELELDSTGTATPSGFIVDPHTLTLAGGTGVDGQGIFQNIAGDNTWSGPVTMLSDSTIGAYPNSSLALAGGAVDSGFTLTKSNGGTLIFPVGSSYTGLTDAAGGSVQVDGTLGNVLLDGGGVSGLGTVGVVTDGASGTGGNVNPGDNYPAQGSAYGTFTNTGGITLSPSDTYLENLGNPSIPNNYDLLDVTNGGIALGNAILNGAIDANVPLGAPSTTKIIETDYNNGANPNDIVTGTFLDEGPPQTMPYLIAGAYAQTTSFVGSNKFIVDYLKDAVYITRELANTTMALSASVPNPVYGQDEVFTAQLTPESQYAPLSGNVEFDVTDPTGNTYQFFEPINSATNAATFDPSAASPNGFGQPMLLGSYTVNAYYNGILASGGQGFNSVSAGPDQVVVTAAPTTTRLAIAPASSTAYGQSLTITATVASTVANPVSGTQPPTGTVSFYNKVGVSSTLLGTVNVGTTAGVTTAVLSTATLPAGSYNIYAVYNGDGIPANYTGSTSGIIQRQISMVSSTTSVVSSVPTPGSIPYSGQVTFTATVAPTAVNDTGYPTGIVTFKLGTTTLGTGTLLTVGGVTTATYTTQPFQIPAGSGQVVTASYAGDKNFIGSSGTVTQNVAQIASSTSVSSSPNPSSAGQTVTITATVSPSVVGGAAPTGSVTFQVNGANLGTVSVSTLFGLTTAVLQTSQIPAGQNQTITATYTGDSNYGGSSNTTQQTVNADTTSTTLTAAPGTVVATQAVQLTATVTASSGGTPFGTVTFSDLTTGATLGSAQLDVNGTATIMAQLLTPLGNHTITAVYNGNSSFSSSVSFPNPTVKVVANGARASSVSVASSLNPAQIGQSVTFTATVKDAGQAPAQTPGGTVAFYDGSTKLGFGTLSTAGGVTTATFTTSSLAIGTHSIKAVYSGSTLFAAVASAVLTETVTTVPTRTSNISLAGPSQDPSTFGQSVIFTATVTDAGGSPAVTPTGVVTFTDTTTNTVLGTANLTASGTAGKATAAFSISSLAVGSHSITATYDGSGTFVAGSPSNAVSHTVTLASSTTTVASSAPSGSVYGQSVTFTAKIALGSGSATPTGTVTFYIGGMAETPVNVSTANGVTTATFTIKTIPVGGASVYAVYSGDSNVNGSTSPAITQNVNPGKTTTALAASTLTSHTAVTFTATVAAAAPSTGAPTGYVTFYIDGTARGTAALSGGKALFTLGGGLAAGSHTVTAVYLGNGDFGQSSKSVTYSFVVGRGT